MDVKLNKISKVVLMLIFAVFATDDSYNLKDYYLAIRCVKD
jgi:hypothetical protein